MSRKSNHKFLFLLGEELPSVRKVVLFEVVVIDGKNFPKIPID
ncbi:hypothetical protein [Brunnivagina elsteri]|nr:hypothetical protein [Calothrix elsteri]